MPIDYSLKRNAQAAVADEAKFHDQTVACANPNEQATLRLHFTGMSPDSSHTDHQERERKAKEEEVSVKVYVPKSILIDVSENCSNADYSDDYKVDRHNIRRRGVKTLKPVSAHFTEALDYKTLSSGEAVPGT